MFLSRKFFYVRPALSANWNVVTDHESSVLEDVDLGSRPQRLFDGQILTGLLFTDSGPGGAQACPHKARES